MPVHSLGIHTQVVVDDDLMEYEYEVRSSSAWGRSEPDRPAKVQKSFHSIRDLPRPSAGAFCLVKPRAEVMAQPVEPPRRATGWSPLLPILGESDGYSDG